MTEDLDTFLSCFVLLEGWWCTKTNDAEWVQVSEDLNDYLTEVWDCRGLRE